MAELESPDVRALKAENERLKRLEAEREALKCQVRTQDDLISLLQGAQGNHAALVDKSAIPGPTSVPGLEAANAGFAAPSRGPQGSSHTAGKRSPDDDDVHDVRGLAGGPRSSRGRGPGPEGRRRFAPGIGGVDAAEDRTLKTRTRPDTPVGEEGARCDSRRRHQPATRATRLAATATGRAPPPALDAPWRRVHRPRARTRRGRALARRPARMLVVCKACAIGVRALGSARVRHHLDGTRRTPRPC